MCLNILPPIMGLLLIGGNGGLAGSDVRILERTGRTVSVTGIGNHELPGLDIVICAALLHTNHGKVILIMHENAFYGRGNTIHSHGQIEWFQNTCDDKSFHVGGKQVITFLDEYALPQLVTPPGPQSPPNMMPMTPGLINMAILRGEFTILSHTHTHTHTHPQIQHGSPQTCYQNSTH